DNRWLDRPGCRTLLHELRHMWNRWNGNREFVAPRRKEGHRLSKGPKQATHFAATRARQDQKVFSVSRCSRSMRFSSGNDARMGCQSMSDIGPGRAAESLQCLRFKREQAQDAIDVRSHCRRAAWPPG